MTANIHIINGDLEMAAASIDSIREGFHGLDAIGAMNGAESAMPASASSGAASGAAAALNDLTAALVGRYGRTSSGTRRLLSIHRSNDEAVAAALPGPSGPTAESTSQWARAKGLD